MSFKKNSSTNIEIWSQGTWHEPYMWQKMQIQRSLQSVNLKGRGYLECLGVDWRITFKWMLNILLARIVFVWLKIRTDGRQFRRQWTAGCIRGEDCVTSRAIVGRVAFHEGLLCIFVFRWDHAAFEECNRENKKKTVNEQWNKYIYAYFTYKSRLVMLFRSSMS